jgi:hypothetical protein
LLKIYITITIHNNLQAQQNKYTNPQPDVGKKKQRKNNGTNGAWAGTPANTSVAVSGVTGYGTVA